MNEENFSNDIDLLERYIAGVLTHEEIAGVRKRLKDEKHFASLYQFLQGLPERMRVKRLKDVLQRLRNLEKDLD